MGGDFDELLLLDVEAIEPTAANEQAFQVDLGDLDAVQHALRGVTASSTSEASPTRWTSTTSATSDIVGEYQ